MLSSLTDLSEKLKEIHKAIQKVIKHRDEG